MKNDPELEKQLVGALLLPHPNVVPMYVDEPCPNMGICTDCGRFSLVADEWIPGRSSSHTDAQERQWHQAKTCLTDLENWKKRVNAKQRHTTGSPPTR